MKTFRVPLLLLTVFCGALCTAFWFYAHEWRYLLYLAGVCVLLLAFLALYFTRREDRAQKTMDEVLTDNRGAVADVVENISIPCLIATAAGRIVWRNKAMEDIYYEKTLQSAMPQLDLSHPSTKQIVWNGSNYQVMHMPLTREHAKKDLVLEYWLDRTEAVHYRTLYSNERPAVMLISLDNFEDMAGDRQFHGTAVLAEVEKLISEMCRKNNAIYCRYESGRFLCIAEAQSVEELEKERFSLMEAARHIETGTGTPVSLSIAVGMEQRIVESEKSARLAMELALGRGGDQTVVREGADCRYYGGKNQQDARQSRVKMRLFAKALRQLFESSSDIFIMGHKSPDVDCIGAAMGIASCAEFVGSRAHLVMEEPGQEVTDALAEMQKIGLYRSLVTDHQTAVAQQRSDSVIVVVDTQRPSTVECAELLSSGSKVVVIDHHRRSSDSIEDTTLHYIESRASSASEMVTEVLQYFGDNIKPNAYVCSMLLAGISLDTKQFAYNVSSRTFEAAGYLRKNGAEISNVSSIFRNDFDQYVEISRIVESARLDSRGVAVSCFPDNVPFNRVTQAQAADQLLKIRGVLASFVVGQEEGAVSISGRSTGEINVQLILERLGGGGHLTMAGAQIKDVSLQEALDLLDESIDKQFEFSQQV